MDDCQKASDVELLDAWANGERAAGSELIERHFAVVHRFFRNKVGAEIEDLVQQTFLACIEGRSRYEGRSSFVTFLLGIARYQLFTHYSRRRREPLDVQLSSVRDLATSPTGTIARREEESLLTEALQRIPLEAQTILELVYWEGLAGVELAAVLEVPLNTAYSRLRRARDMLRTRLEELAPDRAGYQEALRAFGRAAQQRGSEREPSP